MIDVMMIERCDMSFLAASISSVALSLHDDTMGKKDKNEGGEKRFSLFSRKGRRSSTLQTLCMQKKD